jgi:hypothetical protein
MDGRGQEEYIRQVLEAYRQHAGHDGNRAPCGPAAGGATLPTRPVSAEVIENALLLAATRRLIGPMRTAFGRDPLAGVFPIR